VTNVLSVATITPWGGLQIPIDRQWEAAHQRFETPDQEVAKFKRRLKWLGCRDWQPDWQIVELFCGRGNGLLALSQLGFDRLEGVDLSEELLSNYQGSARLYAGDCRQLKFETGSRDVIVVQGGLHHLPSIPEDLDQCLDEIRRVLRPGGYFCMVEPWLTPFLCLTHRFTDSPVARRFWSKLDALAEMISREQDTYQQWLGLPNTILGSILGRFDVELQKVAFGKILLRAKPML
jgi:SAM-dependent methyltransferase